METLWPPLQTKTPWSPTRAATSDTDSVLREKRSALTVGPIDDPLETEADVVADRALKGRAPALGGPPARVHRTDASPSGSGAAAPESVERALSTPGDRLDAGVRRDMEQRFGHDFSRVRVHGGAAVDRSVHELSAHAYTVGRDIVFGQGRYAPESADGRQLLAHELAHVVQQSQSSSPTLQRGSLKDPPTKPHSCGGWTCAPASDCPNPDGKSAPTTAASTSWSLTANLDVDVLKAADVSGPSEVGHAFVEFSESNGDRYTYGHYHNKSQSPDPVFRPTVPGCTAHPDQTHSGCIDMRIAYSLAQAEYKKALDFAKAWCGSGQPYNVLTNNCTTFVENVVKQAGKTIPSSRGTVGSGRLSVTADNPNTLFDAHLSQADNATWRQRVSGDFNGHYDAGGKAISFSKFKLKTDDKLVVAGKYAYPGSSGDTVEGTLDGRLIFNVDAATKAVVAIVKFDWSEPSGTGKGVWTVSASGDLKGTWGRGAAEGGAGSWELAKVP